MNSVRGDWRPALVGLGRVARAWLPPVRPGDVAWTDADGSLSFRDLWASAEPHRRGRSPGAVVICEPDRRELIARILAAVLDRRPAFVVSPRAGAATLRAAEEAARRTRPRRGRLGDVRFTTSGTTGGPRSITGRRTPLVAAQVLGAIGTMPGQRRPVIACLAPLDHGHGFGLWAATMLLGGRFIALDAATAVDTLAAVGRVDLLSGVPVQLADLCDALEARPDAGVSVANVLAGSDRLTPALASRLEGLLTAAVGNAYGSTETGTVCVATPADRRVDPETVGRPLPGCSISADEQGRLVIRSPLLAAPTFAGDAGWVGADGLVRVTGRADGVRVSGGENVAPAALEEWLRGRPGVVGVRWSTRPDARFGVRSEVELTVSDDFAGTPADVSAALAAEFGSAARPARVTISCRASSGGGSRRRW